MNLEQLWEKSSELENEDFTCENNIFKNRLGISMSKSSSVLDLRKIFLFFSLSTFDMIEHFLGTQSAIMSRSSLGEMADLRWKAF